MRNFEIRTAVSDEIDWINRCYQEVDFVPSHFDNEVIAIAEMNGEKAGLGRLVRIDENSLELGGIYVFEAFRGLGIARNIVEFLLKHIKGEELVYCIPFEELLSFYSGFGFIHCEQIDEVPETITTKYMWCRKTYPQPTRLLYLNK